MDPKEVEKQPPQLPKSQGTITKIWKKRKKKKKKKGDTKNKSED